MAFRWPCKLNFNAMWQKPVFCAFEVAKFDFDRHHVQMWIASFWITLHCSAVSFFMYRKRRRVQLWVCGVLFSFFFFSKPLTLLNDRNCHGNVPNFRSFLLIDLGRETEGNNEMCLGVRYALCIIKALDLWLAHIEHCSGTVATRFLPSVNRSYTM